jgi:hypothetical protein
MKVRVEESKNDVRKERERRDAERKKMEEGIDFGILKKMMMLMLNARRRKILLLC